MSRKYDIVISDEIVTVRFDQSPDARDICDALHDIQDSRPGNLRLYDLTCGLKLSTEEIQQVAAYARSLRLPSEKVALVASPDRTYGLLRADKGYPRKERIKHKLFRSERDAKTWLKLPN